MFVKSVFGELLGASFEMEIISRDERPPKAAQAAKRAVAHDGAVQIDIRFETNRAAVASTGVSILRHDFSACSRLHHAATGADVLTSDPAGRRRGQKGNDRGHLMRLTDPAERRLFGCNRAVALG